MRSSRAWRTAKTPFVGDSDRCLVLGGVVLRVLRVTRMHSAPRDRKNEAKERGGVVAGVAQCLIREDFRTVAALEKTVVVQ